MVRQHSSAATCHGHCDREEDGSRVGCSSVEKYN